MKSILAIDDDPAVTSLLVHVLGRSGYEVTTAANGRVSLHVVSDYQRKGMCV